MCEDFVKPVRHSSPDKSGVFWLTFEKNLLALLAASASLSVMLLMANTAYAAPIVAKNLGLVSTPIVRVVSLNLANPTLNLTNQTSNPILHNLGCACASCTGFSKQLSI
ncbi:MAG: hypothetical protein MUD14_02840 [Hydrococcus sp. Prado102]|nr:hypothetical protein [Hydrococcus sp. Prado102]